MDTNMHLLQRDYQPAYKQGTSYEYLGVLGHALNHVDFFLRPEPEAFVFGRGWEPYLKTPERATFYNTKTPFTSIAYSGVQLISQREETIEALHTQNFSPFTNFGIEFNILAGQDDRRSINKSDYRTNRVGLFGSHAKNKYSVFGTLYYNDFKVKDNGGLVDLDSFLEGTEADVLDYPRNLSSASSHYRNLSIFLTQKYNLIERQTFTDTLGNVTTTGKTLTVSHQFHIDRHLKDYKDQVFPESLSPIYDHYYYEISAAKDSAVENKFSNVFQLILGDPDYDKISVRAYAGHELRKFGALSPQMTPVFSFADTLSTMPVEVDSVYRDSASMVFDSELFNDVFIGFHIAGPTTGIWDWVVDGTYYLLGYHQNDFQVNATFSRQIVDDLDLGLRGTMELKRPHYFTNHYSSSFFQWENDFPSLYKIKGEAFIKSDLREIDMRAGAAFLSNYIYWDQDALPQLYDNDLLILSGYFSKHLSVSRFNSESRLLVQYSTANEVLRLPLLAIYTSNYWNQALFKRALIFDVGFDLYLTTRYKASAYMPPTGIFYLQDDYDVGGYPFLDLFLAFRVKRTRIFVSYNNVLHGLGFIGNNYFTAYRYPMKPRHLRFGLVWTFYD